MIARSPGTASVILLRPVGGRAGVGPHRGDCFLGVGGTHARWVLGAAGAPRAIELVHSAPADPREHQRVFRAPIRFEQPMSAMLFAATDGEVPLPSSDPALGKILEHYADELIRQMPDEDA